MKGSEDKNKGWICLHRSIMDHWLWADPVKLKWWLDLLLSVNHSDKKVNIGMSLIDCKRGQTVLSLQNLSERWRVSRDTARNFLTLLKNDGMISTENLIKTTRITICQYDIYQSTLHTNQTLAKPKPNAGQTQADINNNANKANNNKNDNKGTPNGVDGLTKPSADIPEYDTIEKTKEGIYRYLLLKPKIINPYVDFWNLFAAEKNLPKVETISDTRKRKLRVRMNDSSFNFPEIIRNAKDSDFLLGSKWFSFDWIIANDSNYVKVIEGNYAKNQTIDQSPTTVGVDKRILEKMNRNCVSGPIPQEL